MKEFISGAELKEMFISAAASVDISKQQINDLNVFPVPDGDTGTNMALTLGEKADGYSVQAACGLGSITVSGAKQASPYSANSKAANAVILDAALGDITLNFEE